MSGTIGKVLVTGGSGFIGTNLVAELVRTGVPARSIDIRSPLAPSLRNLHVQCDILDAASLASAVAAFEPEFVVHLAARCDLRGSCLEDYAENTRGVLNLIDAVKKCRSVRRVIFASSRYVHSNEHQPVRDDEYSPFTAYGASKVQGEQLVRRHCSGVPWTIVRPTSIWGPWFDVPYKSFFRAVRKGLYVHPTKERVFKSYGYVGNVVHQILALLRAGEKDVAGRVFYTADYEPIEVLDMAQRIRRQFSAPPVLQTPLILLKGIAMTGDLLQRMGVQSPPLTSFRLGNIRAQMVYDLSETAQIAGPLPFDLDSGIRHTVDWMNQND